MGKNHFVKTVIILMGPGQRDDLTGDLHAAQITHETENVAVVLSEEPIHASSEGLIFLRKDSLYPGPTYALGFQSPRKEVRQHRHSRRKLN